MSFESLSNPQFVITALVGLAVFATIVTVLMPLLAADKLASRIKSVSTERAALRAQQREWIKENQKAKAAPSLRQKQTGLAQEVVQALNLRALLETKTTRERLRMAGLRRESHLVTFLFFRIVMPVVMAVATFSYLKLVEDFGLPPLMHLLVSAGAGYLGFYAPNIFVTNVIQNRQKSMKRAFSNALDLLLICVESGMSIEAAFQRVSQEIGSQSIPLAEEMTLATAELSYLQERRQAYENLGRRTGLQSVKAVATALIQAERYGTPVGQALRVMAQENRDMRMSEAEKKAAGLPPKLTVPMIVFFLPVLFVVILGPAYIQLMNME